MQIEHIPDNGCEIRGDYSQKPGKICKSCQQSRPAFERMRSWSVFKPPIRDVLHSMKYKRDLGIGDTLSEAFALFIQAMDDVITTGATVREASQALLAFGAQTVYVVSIARALARHGWDQSFGSASSMS